MVKEKICAVCHNALSEANCKRMRVVSAENAKIWGKLIGTTLYPGDRICGYHLPNSWQKKAEQLDLSSTGDEEEERVERKPVANIGGGGGGGRGGMGGMGGMWGMGGFPGVFGMPGMLGAPLQGFFFFFFFSFCFFFLLPLSPPLHRKQIQNPRQ